MSQGNGQGDLSERERSTLDRLLEGRSDGFKVKVLDLVVRNGWDVDEPSFQILLATGQMEVLLSQFPEEFEGLFRQLLELQRQQFVEQRRFLEAQGVAIQDYLRGVEATGSQLVAGVKEQVGQLKEFAQGRLVQTRLDMQEILVLSKAEKEQFQKELKAQMQVAERQYFKAVEKQARLMVDEAGKIWRMEYWRESLILAAFASSLVFIIGLFAGVRINQNFQQADRVYQWGQRMWFWNQAQYLECQKQERTTCNFHIVDPDQK
jgi:hypothetical protein